MPNCTGFIRHSYDQSILSNLAIKYGIKSFRNPSQGGNHLKKPEIRKKGEWLMYPYAYSNSPDEESNYPTIFHNRRNVGKFRLLLIFLHNKFPRKLKLLIRDMIK